MVSIPNGRASQALLRERRGSAVLGGFGYPILILFEIGIKGSFGQMSVHPEGYQEHLAKDI